jgi:hypothetical protein
MRLLYNWLRWAAGEVNNPIALKPFLNEFTYMYIAAGFLAAYIFHFTRTRNLHSGYQNRYFMVVGLSMYVLVCVYTGYRLHNIASAVDFNNVFSLWVLGTLLQFVLFYILWYYFFRYFFKTQKKYLPALLTFFLHKKNLNDGK